MPDIDLRKRWLKRLTQEEKAHDDFRDAAKAASRAYFIDSGGPGQSPARAGAITYPLFWSTIKVLHGRIYSQPPKPDVRKRYADNPGQEPLPVPPPSTGQPPQPGTPPGAGMSPAGMAGGQPPAQPPQPTVDDNKLALCIERALGYTIDTTSFDNDGHMAVNDLLVVGCGVAKVEMVTKTESQPVMNPMTGQPVMVDKKTGKPPIDPVDPELQLVNAMQDVIVHQELRLRHFSWSQFHWEPQQHWSQVSWVGFDHWMTEDEIEDEFGVDFDKAGDAGGSGRDAGADPGDDKPEANKYKNLFRVTEIWDKDEETVVFVCDEYPEILDERQDPLGLENFFPCPQPMMLNVRGDDLVPQPDYSYCAAMFDYCNNLNNRIAKLTKQIKDIGFYDGAFATELQGLTLADDGTLIPITNLSARLEAVGMTGKAVGYDSVVCKQDNTGKVEVVQQLMELGDVAKQKIWEIYGVADIQRGSTNPNETATAQNIKAQWADIRVGERIRIVALFFRDVFRIMAELLCEKFQPAMLEKMTGLQLNQQELQIIKSDYGRCYAVDVESDSTVVQDEYAEKQQRLEFLSTISQYIQSILPAIEHNAMPADLGKELLLFAINTFKNGRQLEQTINAMPGTTQQLQQLTQQSQQYQQQVQQLTKQLQDMQKKLGDVNAADEQRKNIKTATEAQVGDANATKTQVETAAIAQDIHGKAQAPVPGSNVVTPFKPGPQGPLAKNVATPTNFVG